MWAYATLDFYAIRLFEDMAELVIQRVSGFVNQGLANVAWAYAKVGHKHEELFRVVRRRGTCYVLVQALDL